MTGLLSRLGYRGILDLDLPWDARDDQYKLLDFNPRIGAQLRLFRDAAGTDVVTACYMVENYDPITTFGYWRGGELGLRSSATPAAARWPE